MKKNSQMQLSEEEILANYEAQLAEAQNGAISGMPYSSAMFSGQQKQNLVEWQLDFSKELVDIERLLRSAVLKRDEEGNEEWVENPDESRRLFNEVGVQDILRYIFTMVNKNKVLSNYNEQEIRQRVHLMKHELRTLIYNNYEKYGMDNEYKMNNYSMVVHTIGSLIEDAYRRALNGEERKDLNTARTVNQNEPIMGQGIPMIPIQKRGVISRIMPWNWGKGAYG